MNARKTKEHKKCNSRVKSCVQQGQSKAWRIPSPKNLTR